MENFKSLRVDHDDGCKCEINFHKNWSQKEKIFEDWMVTLKVIDLTEVCRRIAGGKFDDHQVYGEWKHQWNRTNGDNKGTLEWVGDNQDTPLINDFLLLNGLKEKEPVIFFISR